MFTSRIPSLTRATTAITRMTSPFTVVSRSMSLNAPHGGSLTPTMLDDAVKIDAAIASCNVSMELNERQLCDVELVCNGAFSPLQGFMNEDEYHHVVENMRLKNGLLFGLPVVLDTDRDDLAPGTKVLLTQKDTPIAVLDIESRWSPDKPLEALKCYRTSSLEHPGVRMISMERKHEYIGGALTGLARPERVFPCETPAEVRARLPANGDVVAFQCRNPVHRAHYELFIRSLDADNVAPDSVVLVHPTCGPTQEDDIPGLVRYHTYTVLQEQLNNDRVQWAYLPYSMHMAGPREAIQHMMIRKNYGCTHFIIGRDMAGSKSSIDGEDFYGAYDAQEFARANSEELGIQTVESLNLVCDEAGEYITAESAKESGAKVMKLSGTEFRRRLRAGEDIPEWFAFNSVVQVLREHQKQN